MSRGTIVLGGQLSGGTVVWGDSCPGGTLVLGGHLSGGTVVQGDNCPGGQMSGGQMSGGHLSGGQMSHHLPDMDKCCQDIYCLDKCHRYS